MESTPGSSSMAWSFPETNGSMQGGLHCDAEGLQHFVVVAVLSVLAVVAVVKKTRLLFVVTGIGFLCFSIRNQFGINRNVANPVFSRARRLVNPNSNGFVTFVLTNSVRIPLILWPNLASPFLHFVDLFLYTFKVKIKLI